ncbi:3-deoxy-manno-octulosonate cytidylyltransferase [Brackiella oedipodis]|uniref:3-deoxy-manno-octulosonate cytidylyltransferase n=1 Tax=Brackiella oedipodis TaxID=124225 RepID=UPI00048AA2DF|nr:3-deoxy-manno-octulosonate cytidylyltransferase [Brackiella oedipodis]
MTPKFIAIVPARAASTRLPNKMLAPLGEHPLVVHTALRALRSSAQEVYVATDDPQIYEAVAAAGIQVLMTRNDHPSGTDRLAEAVQQLDLDEQTIVVNVQGDEPFIDPALIDQAALCLHQHSQASIATCAYPIASYEQLCNTDTVKVVCAQNGQALYFSRAPIPWSREAFKQAPAQWPEDIPAYHHIGLYAYRTHFLKKFPQLPQGQLERHECLEQLRALEQGYQIQVFICATPPAPGIDNAQDLAKARDYFAQLKHQQSQVK